MKNFSALLVITITISSSITAAFAGDGRYQITNLPKGQYGTEFVLTDTKEGKFRVCTRITPASADEPRTVCQPWFDGLKSKKQKDTVSLFGDL